MGSRTENHGVPGSNPGPATHYTPANNFMGIGEWPPIVDREALDVFRNETTSAIARKSVRLPVHEKRINERPPPLGGGLALSRE
jgi:hypothetical protein